MILSQTQNNPSYSTSSEQYHKDLLAAGKRYAYSFTNNSYDAEDLAQQAWLKLKIKYSDVISQPLLFRAIKNLFLDGVRRNKIVRFESIDNAYNVGTSNSFGSKSDLDEILATLSDAERKSLSLNLLDGYTAKEISEKTGMPRGTILSHIHRGRIKLIDRFGAEFRGGNELLQQAG